MNSPPCAACIALGSRAAQQLHGDLRVTAAIVEIGSRRRHTSNRYLCNICGSRWNWSAAAGWNRYNPMEQSG